MAGGFAVNSALDAFALRHQGVEKKTAPAFDRDRGGSKRHNIPILALPGTLASDRRPATNVRDCPLTGHRVEIAKSTRLTRNGSRETDFFVLHNY